MKTGRYMEGQQNRQAILDYVNAHPGAFGPEIQDALGIDKSTGAGRLQRMTNSGELRREREIYEGIDRDGNQYKNLSFRYWALVKTTRSQQDVAITLAANVRAKEKPEPEDKRAQKWIGGSFRNTKHDRGVTPCPDSMRGIGYRGMTQLEAMA